MTVAESGTLSEVSLPAVNRKPIDPPELSVTRMTFTELSPS
ncbi:hypothetical protein [Tomitella biformata]|nr:hypothetical protein [Tomitella biformata]